MRLQTRGSLASIVLVLLFLVPFGAAVGQQSPDESPPTPAPKLMSSGDQLKTAIDECKSHPSVVAAGTPLELCMEAYGFVRDGSGKGWAQKPATR